MPASAEPSPRGRWPLLLALLAALALVAAACGGDDDSSSGGDTSEGGGGLLAELQDRGSITIGIANEVPFGFVGEDGEATGIAPDVAKAVLAELGIEEVDAQVVEFGQLIGGLQAGQYDLIAAGMYITPERAQQILFSDPDYCVAAGLAVQAGNPKGIVDFQSFVDDPDLRLGVATGTVEVDYATDAGIPDSQMQVYGDIEGMYAAVAAGEVDAAAGTSAAVQRQVAARSQLEAVEPFFPVDADGEEVLPCGGYGFRRGDEDFRDAFNEVLNRFREDGTTTEIITGYEDFTEEDVAKANELTLEDFLE